MVVMCSGGLWGCGGSSVQRRRLSSKSGPFTGRFSTTSQAVGILTVDFLIKLLGAPV